MISSCYRRSWLHVLLASVIVGVSAIGVPPAAVAQQIEGVPGGGEPVRIARPSWDTGWFQAEIVASLLGELGYRVEGPTTMENDAFYTEVAAGTVDLWVNGWFPLHDQLLQPGATRVGFEVRGGALQGYMVDADTAERFGLETIADLTDPEVAAAFDRDGDGLADLVGCNQAWACQPIIEHHLDAYGLGGRVEQVSGDYGPLMLDVAQRFEAGEAVLFYTFTPNWTTGVLVPGRDVLWLPVPFPSRPADFADQEAPTSVSGLVGCLSDPCDLGFAPNDIRSVVNQAFVDANPAIAALLERFEISLDDISAQNALMIGGEDSAVDIARHASEWLETNRVVADSWIDAAIEAHIGAGLELFAPRDGADRGPEVEIDELRVVTRIEAPFVTYDDQSYGGFSIELVDLLAEALDADLEIYGVNSSAKLLDDVSRGAADLGVGAVAITSTREISVDFSQPYYESGLQILVANDSDAAFGGRLGAVVSTVFSRDLLVLVLVLIAVLIAAAHVVWLAERKTNPDFPAAYLAGIWEAIWWAAVTATTVGYGDKTPKGRTGRLFGLFWMFSGLFVLAYFTAGIATAFTIEELDNNIESISDLRGHQIGVPVGSDAHTFLALQGIPAEVFPSTDETFDALISGDLDAVVHDAAVLQHFITAEPDAATSLTGVVFAERGFGLVLPAAHELNEQLNRALLGVVESSEYRALHDKWFGRETGSG